jgi:allantoate deiminase
MLLALRPCATPADGPLGLITAIASVADLNRRGQAVAVRARVAGFADEEGVRFARRCSAAASQARLTKRAQARDRGTSMRGRWAFGLDPVYRRGRTRARGQHVELHRAGAVLEQKGFPVGVVRLAGATRLAWQNYGMAGTPHRAMALRRLLSLSAAECIARIEEFCRTDSGLVGTVGYIDAKPRHQCDPGKCLLYHRYRAPSDMHRKRAVAIVRNIQAIAKRRQRRGRRHP